MTVVSLIVWVVKCVLADPSVLFFLVWLRTRDNFCVRTFQGMNWPAFLWFSANADHTTIGLCPHRSVGRQQAKEMHCLWVGWEEKLVGWGAETISVIQCENVPTTRKLWSLREFAFLWMNSKISGYFRIFGAFFGHPPLQDLWEVRAILCVVNFGHFIIFLLKSC